MEDHILFYQTKLYDLLRHFTLERIHQLDNHDLSKMFEYVSCIQLSKDLNKNIHSYDFISPSVKETLRLPKNDVGIDCCDLSDTLVQCKLYQRSIPWKSLSTFLACQNGKDDVGNTIVRWKNMILYRNQESSIGANVPLCQREILDERIISRSDFLSILCKIKNTFVPLILEKENNQKLYPFQVQCVNAIVRSDKETKNCVICIPTGTGKTTVALTYISMYPEKKICVLVPKLVLLDQWYEKTIQYMPKEKVCLVGSGFDMVEDKSIEQYSCFICVYNSFEKISHVVFDKLFIDEAHNIWCPEEYQEVESDVESDIESDSMDEEDEDEINDDNDEQEEYEDEQSDDYDNEEETYKTIIKKTKENNNVVELSATIESDPNSICYNYSLRQAIQDGYLTDYDFMFPVFSKSPDDRNVAKYLIRKGIHHCIVYVKSREQARQFSSMLNELLANSAEFIDCDTSRKERERIITLFEKGDIRFLINVRILIEGFDAPIAENCVFLHLSPKDVFVMQCIGRVLRKYESKKKARVFIPCCEEEEGKMIGRFMSIICKYDELIHRAAKNKLFGSYINVVNKKRYENGDDEDDDSDEEEDMEAIHLYDTVLNSIGNCLDVDLEKRWYKKLEELTLFIETHWRRPNRKKETEKVLSKWVAHQIDNWRRKRYIMSNEEIYRCWKEFQIKFQNTFQTFEDKWFSTFQKVCNFINEEKRLPSKKYEKERFLANWINNQNRNYNEKDRIMKNNLIYHKWSSFLETNNKLFQTIEQLWKEKLNELQCFLDKNKTRPSSKSKIKEECYLGRWIVKNNKECDSKINIMSNDYIRSMWSDFKTKYKELVMTKTELWYDSFDRLKTFILENNRRPVKSKTIKEETELYNWASNQIKNFETISESMKIKDIYSKWSEFFQLNKQFFKTNEEIWIETLEKVETYIEKNNKRPSSKSKIEEEASLGMWITHTKSNALQRQKIMKNDYIFNKWLEFYKKYEELLLSKEEKWFNVLDEIIKYISENKKRPCERYYSAWLTSQLRSSQNKTSNGDRQGIFKNDEINEAWNKFYTENSFYLMNKVELWFLKFDELKTFIDEHKRLPSRTTLSENETILYNWFQNNKRNCRLNKKSMKTKEIKEAFCLFAKKHNISLD